MFPAVPQQCIQHLTPGWEWCHQPFNAETSAASCYTKNSKIPFKEILPFSAKIHKVNVETTFPAAWKHPLPKANSFSWQLGQLSHDSCHSFSWQLGQLFSRQLWQLTQQPAHHWFFHILLKPKPTIGTTFLLLKYLSFMMIFPQKLLPKIAKIP